MLFTPPSHPPPLPHFSSRCSHGMLRTRTKHFLTALSAQSRREDLRPRAFLVCLQSSCTQIHTFPRGVWKCGGHTIHHIWERLTVSRGNPEAAPETGQAVPVRWSCLVSRFSIWLRHLNQSSALPFYKPGIFFISLLIRVIFNFHLQNFIC